MTDIYKYELVIFRYENLEIFHQIMCKVRRIRLCGFRKKQKIPHVETSVKMIHYICKRWKEVEHSSGKTFD